MVATAATCCSLNEVWIEPVKAPAGAQTNEEEETTKLGAVGGLP